MLREVYSLLPQKIRLSSLDEEQNGEDEIR